MVSIISFVPLLFIVLIVLVIVGVKTSPEKEGGEEMIKNVYIYLVLFATLMMTIGGSVGAFMAIADIVAPAPYYQTFEDYKRYGGDRYLEKEGVQVVEKLSEEELRANYDAMIESAKNNQIQRAKNTLVKSFGWILIPLPVFIYYQRRLVKKDTTEE